MWCKINVVQALLLKWRISRLQLSEGNDDALVSVWGVLMTLVYMYSSYSQGDTQRLPEINTYKPTVCCANTHIHYSVSC